MSTKKIIIICGVIVLIAIASVVLIFSTEPTAKSEGAVKESAMLVSLTTVERKEYTPLIEATGTVRPLEDVIISPLVSGPIVKRSPNFLPGSFVKEGELLLQINPADYRNELALEQGNLNQQKTNLEIEMGRQEVAKLDLNLIGIDSISDSERKLVLRQPQLNAVKATIQSAQANVNQASLNLNRTSIRAPFDAHILSQNVTVGSQVAPGDDLGRLVGTKYYLVEVNIPVSKLRWLRFPNDDNTQGASVTIRNTSSWPDGASREGFLDKQIGALEGQTRLARVLVKVPEPLGNADVNKPDLIIGSFVDVSIQGKSIANVVRLDRDYVRPNNTAWVMKDGKLEIRQLKIQLTDVNYAYVMEGLDDGDRIVITNLSTVAEGVDLKEDKKESASSMDNNSTGQ